MRLTLGCLTILLVLNASLQAVEACAAIKATEAKDHVGETVYVAFPVKHAKDGTHRESYFLDSEADYKDPKNLAVVIKYERAAVFRAAGINDIVAYYDGKTIKVSGKIMRNDSQTQILVNDPEQIQVVTP